MAGFLFISGAVYIQRSKGFTAKEQPGSLERWVARASRDAAIPTNVKQQRNPIVNTPEVLSEARVHWADHCAGCHATWVSTQAA